VPSWLKLRALLTILNLGKGLMDKEEVRHPLEGAPPGMRLFSARVNRYGPRDLEAGCGRFRAPQRGAAGQTEGTGSAIFVKTVRIWRVDFQHDDQAPDIRKIAQSHLKGKGCSMRRGLHCDLPQGLHSGWRCGCPPRPALLIQAGWPGWRILNSP
jgi:hypothetical protein